MLTVLLAQAAASDTTKELAETMLQTDAATKAVETTERSFSIWSSIAHSDPIVQMTLALLIFFSVGCWAVIFMKIFQLQKAQKSAQNFWHRFSSSPRIGDMKGAHHEGGPLREIFQTGSNIITKVKDAGGNALSTYQRNVLAQRMIQTKEEEVFKLEQYISFLATTASVAPFIGLFGTVWGILTAFMVIGKEKTSSLATVGPYISEALVATAVGLFAAIPAVIAYNYFVGKIRLINKMIDLFIDDFMLKSEKEIA